MFPWFKNIFHFLTRPTFTILLSILTLSVFLYHTINYCFIVDDYYLLAITLKRSFLESMGYLYFHVNGRWFSNILTSFIFGVLGCKVHLYWYVQLTQFLLFIISISFLFKSIFSLNTRQGLHLGALFTCLFYWFCFDSRVEIWYWEASCLVHLVCFICIFLLYGIIFNQRISSRFKIILVIFLSLFIGGLSETFALACILFSSYIVLRNRKSKNNSLHVFAVLFITLSLAVDYFCPGTKIRLHNQPSPELLLGIKNTFYSFYLQLAKIKYLPFKLMGLLLVLPFSSLINKYNSKNDPINFSKLDCSLIALLILQNTFIPAYLTSFETPDRVFALNWLLILFLLVNYFEKKKTELTSFLQ